MTCLKYLEWKALVNDVSKENTKQFILDEMILFMRKLLSDKEFKLEIPEFKGYRHDQRFSLSEESNKYVRDFAEQHNLLIAEALEVLLYLYFELVLSHSEVEQNGLKNWNIKVEWKN